MKKMTGAEKTVAADPEGEDFVDLRLYVAGATPRCLTAYENIRRICNEHAGDSYRITVIDLRKDPGLARTDDITAIPTLVRIPRAAGSRKLVGMLADTGKVIEAMDLTKKIMHEPGTIRKNVPTC